MTPTAASTALKAVALFTIFVGLGMLYLILGVGLPTALRYNLGSALVLTIPLLAFAAYTLYLGYSLFSRLSRTAFERIWFGATILVAVIIGRRLPSFAAYASAAGIGLISLLARSFITRHLFPDDRHV
jgi:hypothetical protein